MRSKSTATRRSGVDWATFLKFASCANTANILFRNSIFNFLVQCGPVQSPEANITPAILQWARESANLSLEAVADVEKIHPTTLHEWEIGTASPTYAQLERLAHRYRRPTMVFFLEDMPPSNVVKLKDYRRQKDSLPLSSEAIYITRQAIDQQAWASDYLEAGGASPLGYVGKYTTRSGVKPLAVAIRKLLAISLNDQKSFTSDREGFNGWRAACEKVGLLTFVFPGVSVAEIRGFAIADRFAPVIAVNSKDTYAARSFSLLHELTHILIGDSSLSSRDYGDKSDIETERFCEEVAAETMMPSEDFTKLIPATIDDPFAVATKLADLYRCSKSAALFRLVDFNRISMDKAIEIVSERPAISRKSSGPIPRDVLALSRNGRYFSRVAVSAYHGGEIHGGQLSKLIGLSLKHLPKYESALMSTRAHGQEPQVK
ncbi:ImmA/IrrE family metallo-endopeptidase [Rhodopirellula baltica]